MNPYDEKRIAVLSRQLRRARSLLRRAAQRIPHGDDNWHDAYHEFMTYAERHPKRRNKA